MTELFVELVLLCLIISRFVQSIRFAREVSHIDPVMLCFDILTGAGALLCAYALGSMN